MADAPRRATLGRRTFRCLAGALLVATLGACDARGSARDGAAASRTSAASGTQSSTGGAPAGQTASRMENYEWLASNSGPAGCPMEIVGGQFSFPAGGSLYIPKANVHAGWGRDVSVHVVGDDRKPIPDRVEVQFFSFLENKFYRGSFALPRDSIARLFHDGFQRVTPPGGHATYEALVAGVAPGGAVAVWASGSDRQVEVFFGQAEPADLDFHRAFDAPDNLDRRGFVADELDEAAKLDPLVRSNLQRVPLGRWAAFRTRYRWRPAFERMAAPARLGPVNFLNGERDYLPLPLDAAAQSAARPIPGFLAFSDPGTARSYEVTFDEDEALGAFAQAGGGARSSELVFTPGGDGGLRVAVRGPAGSVELRKAKVKTFGTR